MLFHYTKIYSGELFWIDAVRNQDVASRFPVRARSIIAKEPIDGGGLGILNK